MSRWFMEAATVTWLVKLIEIQGADVILSHSGNPSRKTAYDLIVVYKPGIGLVNIDSQAPNMVVKEWLQA